MNYPSGQRILNCSEGSKGQLIVLWVDGMQGFIKNKNCGVGGIYGDNPQ